MGLTFLALTIGVLLEVDPKRVVRVIRGMYGIREALNFSPDLIVLDICFPAGGGLPVLERLKTNLRTKSIPILILTGLEDEEVERQAFELGAAGYALKPIKPEEVLQEVNRLLSPKAKA